MNEHTDRVSDYVAMLAERSVAEHTWIAVGNEVHDKPALFDECGTRIGDTPNRICEVEYPYGHDAGKHSIARLMAAAPELLEACRAIAALADGQGRMNLIEVAGMARTALARAEGVTK